jgi:hypothetical protein
MIGRATLWCLLIAAAGAAMTGAAFGEGQSGAAKTTAVADACNALPSEISRVLSERFTGWVLQSPDRLSSSARDRWQAENPLGCPGIAGGKFASANSAAIAVLVVGSGENKGQGKLLSFVRSETGYKTEVLEQIPSGAPNYFVHAAKASQFFDSISARKFGVAAADVIALFDAGTAEYEVDVYFWTGASFHHEPVDY